MTAAALIELLQRVDPIRPVAMPDSEGDPTEVVGVRDFGPDDYVMLYGERDAQ